MAYNKSQIDRIGNLLVYLTEKLGPLPKTKLLKLIYIIEEESVKRGGTPFTDLTYTHFNKGPVATFVFKQLSGNKPALSPFVKCDQGENEHTIIPVASFDDREFSEFDLDIVDNVIARFGHETGYGLSKYTHRPGSLWLQIKEEYEAQGKPYVGLVNFDFTKLLDDPDVSEHVRESARDSKALIDLLTS